MVDDGPHSDAEAVADEHVHRVLGEEVGEELADTLRRARHAQEAYERELRPEEGLRERKRRETRKRISDVATVLFSTRGFDNVRVAEIAEIVGVSEKTIYNYFPSKESLVLDIEDEIVSSLARALRERQPGESVTSAILRSLKRDMEQFDVIPEELIQFFPSFRDLIQSTPSLRAAWLDLHNRLAQVAREELAAGIEVDPLDPEPMIAARALVGLGDVAIESRVRHIEAGLRGADLREAVISDLDRAGRLLDTGLWSFQLLAHGRRTRQQMLDAAKAADEARAQVLKALRQARAAWRVLRS